MAKHAELLAAFELSITTTSFDTWHEFLHGFALIIEPRFETERDLRKPDYMVVTSTKLIMLGVQIGPTLLYANSTHAIRKRSRSTASPTFLTRYYHHFITDERRLPRQTYQDSEAVTDAKLASLRPHFLYDLAQQI